MSLYSSISRGCFLDDTINELPEDACPISGDQHQVYLRGQAAGKIIDFSTTPPTLMDRPPMSLEQLADIERRWRDARLAGTDDVVTRHRDELEERVATTLTDDQYHDVQAYRRQLRNWPISTGFPEVAYRPVSPSWLVEQES